MVDRASTGSGGRGAPRRISKLGDYIAADDPIAAERWVGRLLDQASKAAVIPFGGRVVPEFKMDDLREVFLRTYRIVYRIRDDEVQVITVFEGHHLFPSDVDINGDE